MIRPGGEGVEKGGVVLAHCWWDCEFVHPPQKSVWRLLKNLKIELPYDFGISLLGTYPKDCMPSCRQRGSSVFITALFTIARKLNQLRCSSANERIVQTCQIHPMGFYSPLKKNGIMNFSHEKKMGRTEQ